MRTSKTELFFILVISLFLGTSFGLWQSSVFAGLFMFLASAILISMFNVLC